MNTTTTNDTLTCSFSQFDEVAKQLSLAGKRIIGIRPLWGKGTYELAVIENEDKTDLFNQNTLPREREAIDTLERLESKRVSINRGSTGGQCE